MNLYFAVQHPHFTRGRLYRLVRRDGDRAYFIGNDGELYKISLDRCTYMRRIDGPRHNMVVA